MPKKTSLQQKKESAQQAIRVLQDRVKALEQQENRELFTQMQEKYQNTCWLMNCFNEITVYEKIVSVDTVSLVTVERLSFYQGKLKGIALDQQVLISNLEQQIPEQEYEQAMREALGQLMSVRFTCSIPVEYRDVV